MFSPPSLTVLRCSKRSELIEEIDAQLPSRYECRFMSPPKCIVDADGDDMVVFIPNRFDDQVKPKRHPCDIGNYDEQVIIVDTSCGGAVLRGADIFAPGVVTCTETFVDDVAGVWCDISNDPRNRFGKGKDTFILKGARFPINAEFKEKLVFIGYGRVVIPRKDLFCEQPVMNGISIQMTRPVFDCPPISNEFLKSCKNEASLQNYGSIQICKSLLNAIKASGMKEKDLSIFDMCSAPGGKTAFLINALPNCKWYAGDKPSRINLVSSTVTPISESLDVSLQLVPGDSTATAFPDGFFNSILLDAPCSATGSRPKPVFGNTSARQVKSYQKLQRKLLHEAIRLLKSGGILVYSTCSIMDDENAKNVSYVLEKYKNIKLEDEVAFNPFKQDTVDINGIRHIPNQCDKFDTIGFFCAQFKKD